MFCWERKIPKTRSFIAGQGSPPAITFWQWKLPDSRGCASTLDPGANGSAILTTLWQQDLNAVLFEKTTTT
jgi:hypothetical protein